MSMIWGFQGSAGESTHECMTATEPPPFFFLLRIATSDQGWMNNNICIQWFRDVFIPFTQGHNTSGTPILLIVDGHASHETPEMQWLCYVASPPVITYCLPPKTTHKLQLLDVGVFGHLQNTWAKHMQECAAQKRMVSCKTVVEEYLKICRKHMSVKAIQLAFRHCGIWPFNPRIFLEAKFSPSKTTSTCSNAPPSYPAEVPSSPSAAVMTNSNMDDLMYHGSSDMGSDGSEDGSDVGNDHGDGNGSMHEDGNMHKDRNTHAVSFFRVFFPTQMH